MRRDPMTLLAFLGIVLTGGFNGIGIKLSILELPPFWSGALRLGVAAAIFFALMALRRVPLPRGRALMGSVVYGLLNFALFLSLMYWALQTTPAGFTMVILAVAPLLTLLLAAAQRLERLHALSVLGTLIALGGIAVIAYERVAGHAASLPGLIAIGVAALAMAETNVAVKRFPRAHPIATNAVATSVGAVALLIVSLVAGERWLIPQHPTTIVALGYVSIFGTVALFMFFLAVIERWTATATSYALLLMPLVAVAGAAVLLDEPITPAFAVGAVLVLFGVYVGAFRPSIPRPLPALFHRLRPQVAESPTLIVPPCP